MSLRDLDRAIGPKHYAINAHLNFHGVKRVDTYERTNEQTGVAVRTITLVPLDNNQPPSTITIFLAADSSDE